MQEIDVVAGVITVDGKVVLAQRKKGDHCGGMWEFPGGKIEKGETPEDALTREIREELGMEVLPQRRLLTLEHTYPEKKVRLHFILARGVGTPRALDCQSVALVDPAEVESFNLAPADRRAWRRIKEDTAFSST